ncbi:hypothetical protein ACHQM5_002047 [Ranunculus cassubicifolius]
MEPNPTSSQVLSSKRKFSNTVRMILFIIRNRFTNSKFLTKFRNEMNKYAKIASTAVGGMMKHHQSACAALVVQKDYYEFSCSSTPAHHVNSKWKSYQSIFFSPVHPTIMNKTKAVGTLERILEMLDSEVTEASPVIPSFGCTPVVRQLRITDSPFPLRDIEENNQVDKEADEFIQRFYAQLRLQKMIDN